MYLNQRLYSKPTYSEAELVSLLQQKDEQAFSNLYDNYSGALFNIITQIVPDREIASDVLQEVFLNIWRKISSYDAAKGRLFTWMLNIARNAAIDKLRSRAYQDSLKNQSLPDDAAAFAGHSVVSVTDDYGLRKLVNKLKDEQKVLVELSYFQGFTHEEIAKTLNIPLGTVKNQDPECAYTTKNIDAVKVNIKDYISSGMVESYVLGLSSADENREFEQLCARYPELVAARNEFEIALEKRLFSEAVAPVTSLKSRIMDSIQQDTLANQAQVIDMEDRKRSSSVSPIKWVAAAAVILLLVSAYFAYDFYNRNKELEAKLAQSKDVETDMNEKMKKLEEETRMMNMMSDPNVAVVNMVGTQAPVKSTANVYWDSTSSNVFLVVKNMPQLPSEKQYQLWALIDGQPKDLGLFDVGNNQKLILKMKNTQKADAFAITIETRGNTGGPTLEQMQSHGKTSL